MMRKHHTTAYFFFFTVIALTSCLITFPSNASAWSDDPTVNTPICTANHNQRYPTLTSDGSGGAIITWEDWRSGSYDIYAQRVDASGTPRWAANGVAISTALNDQENPTITSDGSGGAIITWQDWRSGTNGDIYAQRIDASGSVQWEPDGVPICTTSGNQWDPQITSDGSDGAIITWRDCHSDTNGDIHARRVDASGTPLWITYGVFICTASGNQQYPQITSDGSGGAIITWEDWRTGTKGDIYARRVNASGVVQWTSNGVAICTTNYSQYKPQITSDGSGGAIITWQDNRSVWGGIYAQRVDAYSTPLWTTNGVGICTASEEQSSPQITSDGSGGAIITWEDWRTGTKGDIYARRVNASGVVQWTPNGVAICTTIYSQYEPQITSDGSGGAIIIWRDYRSDINGDIYARRVDASGTPLWTTNGVGICTASGGQMHPTITSDGSGGAIITWEDERSDTNGDIYAQRIYRNGTLSDFPWLLFYPAILKK